MIRPDEDDDMALPLTQTNCLQPNPSANSFRYKIPNGKNLVHAWFYCNKKDRLFPCVCGRKFATPDDAIEHVDNSPEDAQANHLLACRWPKS